MSPSALILAWPFAAAAIAVLLCAHTIRRELGTPLHRAAALCGCAVLALAFLLTLTGANPNEAAPIAVLVVTCALIAEIDRRSHIIPDLLVGALLLLATANHASFERLAAATIIGAVFFAVRALGSRWRREEVLGLGDVKLAAAMGAVLGLQPALLAVFAAGAATLAVVAMRLRSARSLHAEATAGAPFGIGLASALAVISCARLWL